MDTYLSDIGAARIITLGLGDECNDFKGFYMFSKRLKVFLESPRVDLNEESKETTLVDYSTDEDGAEEENELLDIEDVGLGLKKNVSTDKTPKKMVTPKLRASLEKQRYKIVGSHSGVKVRKAG